MVIPRLSALAHRHKLIGLFLQSAKCGLAFQRVRPIDSKEEPVDKTTSIYEKQKTSSEFWRSADMELDDTDDKEGDETMDDPFGIFKRIRLRISSPHMLDHIRGINDQLKRVEDLEMSASSASSRSHTVHRRVRETFSSVRPRSPSPARSNFSSRDSGSAFSASNKSWKRGSKGAGFLSNPGEWD
jgi:hypothetical protein